ncbi:MAG: hypothetical protein PHH85_14640, partial [Candidatus Methanoperedens sp.]|nr:hypothetical protein [Candidatus Methanoperedens sp.]
FDRLWEMGFQDDVPIGKGHFWCDGHFAFALRAAKKMFKADKERIWQTIERMKKAQFEYFMHSYEKDFIQHCKYVCNAHNKKDKARDIEWAERAWRRHNEYRKELGLPEISMPEIFSLEYMNPLNWGDEER